MDKTLFKAYVREVTPPPGMGADNPTVQAINKDYSALMKKMGLSK